MVKYLCEQGADVKLVDKESHSLVHWATGRSFCFTFLLIDELKKVY